MLVWGYAFFNLLTTVALFVPRIASWLRWAFIGDILFLLLLTAFAPYAGELFYPLYLLPLVGAVIQLRRTTGVALGLITAVSYTAIFVMNQNSSPPQESLAIITSMLHAMGMILVPWLVGGMAERWSASNRMSVVLAEQKSQEALNDANAYRDQMRALYEVAYTLSTTANYQNVLDSTLAESRKLVPYSCGLVLLSSGEPDELYAAATNGINLNEQSQHIRVGKGAIAESLRSSGALVVEEIGRESEFQAIPALANYRSACLVPLRAGLNTYGVILFVADRPKAFNQDQVEMLAALANYAIIALQNAQLIFDLRAERSKLLSKEEEVRHQLARDLHDGPAQAMAAIAMNIEFIKRLIERDPPRIVPELDKLGILAKRTTHEIRTMLFELRPLALETQGLDVTLHQYFERFQGNGTQIILEAKDVTAHLNTKVEGTLFNIIQESVNNALKHAKADHIWVRITQTPTTLEAIVQDDGRGFDLQKVKASYEKRGSFGLLNIEERAGLIGGMAELSSAPGKGTMVHVTVPLNN